MSAASNNFGDPNLSRVIPRTRTNADAFLSAIRQLEEALIQERTQYQKVKEQLDESVKVYDRLFKEKDYKLKELEIQTHKATAALSEYRKYEIRTKSELQSLRAELQQYRAGWSEVLMREKEAKQFVRKYEDDQAKLASLEAKLRQLTDDLANEKSLRDQIERHSKSYQLELQNTLVRLHSAEAKFSELLKEQQLINRNRRVFDDELAKAETSLRERLEWEFSKERERLRAELERDSANELMRERERVRQEIQQEASKTQEAKIEQTSATIAAQIQSQEKILDGMMREADRKIEEKRAQLRALTALSDNMASTMHEAMTDAKIGATIVVAEPAPSPSSDEPNLLCE